MSQEKNTDMVLIEKAVASNNVYQRAGYIIQWALYKVRIHHHYFYKDNDVDAMLSYAFRKYCGYLLVGYRAYCDKVRKGRIYSVRQQQLQSIAGILALGKAQTAEVISIKLQEFSVDIKAPMLKFRPSLLRIIFINGIQKDILISLLKLQTACLKHHMQQQKICGGVVKDEQLQAQLVDMMKRIEVLEQAVHEKSSQLQRAEHELSAAKQENLLLAQALRRAEAPVVAESSTSFWSQGLQS